MRRTFELGRAALPLLCAGALLALSACNAVGPRSPEAEPLSYPAARALDLLDIVELNVGGGAGLFVGASVEPARVAYGYYDSTKLGMMGRAVGSWDERRRELFLGALHVLHWEKEPCFGSADLFDPWEIHRQHWLADPTRPGRKMFYEEWGWTSRIEDWERPWLDVTAEVHLLFVGVDVGVSIQDAFDFVLGLFTVDTVSHDDFEAMPADAMPLGEAMAEDDSDDEAADG